MHILIVEDDVKLANLIKQVLEQEFNQVDVSNDGEEGLEMALTVSYDLIILDFMLPGVDGLGICRALRQAYKQVPVLMLTARDAIQDRVLGLNAGADDYLVKPFAFEELIARVQALSRRQLKLQDLSKTVLSVEDLTLDLLRHEVTRKGKRIDLTAKEYALLEYLMVNAGRVLTRTQIIEHVWQYDFDATSNVVDIYIYYLRSKIDKGSDKKLIKTLRGAGYSLRVD